ncbi:unnamed protein product [Arctogadus glacialis]
MNAAVSSFQRLPTHARPHWHTALCFLAETNPFQCCGRGGLASAVCGEDMVYDPLAAFQKEFSQCYVAKFAFC